MCIYDVDDNSKFVEGEQIYIKFGTGFSGVIAEANTFYEMLRLPSLLDQTPPEMYPTRVLLDCQFGTYGLEPLCLEEGCGNGVYNSDYDSTEEYCDDGNTIDGDGCSSTCEVEPTSNCTTNSVTFRSGCYVNT